MDKNWQQIIDGLLKDDNREEDELEPICILRDHPELLAIKGECDLQVAEWNEAIEEYNRDVLELKERADEAKKAFWERFQDTLLIKGLISAEERDTIPLTLQNGVVFRVLTTETDE